MCQKKEILKYKNTNRNWIKNAFLYNLLQMCIRWNEITVNVTDKTSMGVKKGIKFFFYKGILVGFKVNKNPFCDILCLMFGSFTMVNKNPT